MRRGSRSGPSDETANATPTVAASVCAVVVRPAALRTMALRRGRTARTRPSERPTQSPTPTSRPSCISRPGSRERTGPRSVQHAKAPRGGAGPALRPDVEGAAVDGCDAARHETGLQVFGELVIPAELA